jgi:hypothetical protein
MRKNILLYVMIGILIILPLSLLFSHIEYRLFCTLEQTVDWNAVSAIAEMFMALFTIIAVIIAIYIPQKERITTAKIELFNQRFVIYSFILKNFMKAFEEGKTAFDGEYLLTLGMKTDFLINKEDDIKLTEILKGINEKITLKFIDESNPNKEIKIEEEIKSVDQIFDKYLNLRDYGIEHRSHT